MTSGLLGLFSSLLLSLPTLAALDLPPQVAEAFRNVSVGEEGYLASSNGGRELILEYVKKDWKELLDGLEGVPSPSGTVGAAAMIVGLAAEELPPLDYLDFLDHYLIIYSRGIVGDESLRMQLGGMDRKNHFISVNYEHPRVRALLLRAKELVPKDNAEFQEYLDEQLAGKLSDMYSSGAEDARPPETLPGIKLRAPFESLMEKAKRLGMLKDESEGTRLPKREINGQSDPEKGGAFGGSVSPRGIWGAVAALAILVFALWKGFFKSRFAEGRRSFDRTGKS